MASFKKFAMNIPPRMAGTMSGYADTVAIRAMEKAMRKELESLLAAFSDGATWRSGRTRRHEEVQAGTLYRAAVDL